jgi:hypothetical protein
MATGMTSLHELEVLWSKVSDLFGLYGVWAEVDMVVVQVTTDVDVLVIVL